MAEKPNLIDQDRLEQSVQSIKQNTLPISGRITVGQKADTPIGENATAEGVDGNSAGIGSHTEGTGNIALGDYSHVEGQRNIDHGDYSHIEGIQTTVIPNDWALKAVRYRDRVVTFSTTYPTAELFTSNFAKLAVGMTLRFMIYNGDPIEVAIAEINTTDNTITVDQDITGFNAVVGYIAIPGLEMPANYTSHAEGRYTVASGLASHAEGETATAVGNASHAEGRGKAIGARSHAEGGGTASGDSSHAEGTGSATEFYAHAEGESKAYGRSSHAEGNSTAVEKYSHAEGYMNRSEGMYSHAEGDGTKSVGMDTHSEGKDTVALGEDSHAEGDGTITSGWASHAEGVLGGVSSEYDTLVIKSADAATKKIYFDKTFPRYADAIKDIAAGRDVYVHSNEISRKYLTVTEVNAEEGWITVSDSIKDITSLRRTSTILDPDQLTLGSAGSHSEGSFNTVMGEASHVEGYQNLILGDGAHAEGRWNIVRDQYCHAEGYSNELHAECAHVEGQRNFVYVKSGHAEGAYSICILKENVIKATRITDKVVSFDTHFPTDELFTTNFGLLTVGMELHYIAWNAEPGYLTIQSIDTTAHTITVAEDGTGFDTSMGYMYIPGTTIPNETTSHVEGRMNAAIGIGAHAEGTKTCALGMYSHTEGIMTNASGDYSHAEGQHTTASGNYSHSEGVNSAATGMMAHSEAGSLASGARSHAEGTARATGGNAHAEGVSSQANGETSHSEGYMTKANGKYSHTQNSNTIASADSQTAMGVYNIESTDVTDRLIIGKGTGSSARANCFRVNDAGVFASGAYSASGADYSEQFEWDDGNPNNEDRRGLFVTQVGEQIRVSSPEDDLDDVIGIVSAAPSVIGDAYDDQWQGMYVNDLYGTPIYEEVTVPAEYAEFPDPEREGEIIQELISPEHIEIRQKLNPNYDPSKPYIPRSKRPEWAAIGMLGKLVLRDDGTSVKYVRVGAGGMGTHSDTKTNFRVLSRLDANHIRVLVHW